MLASFVVEDPRAEVESVEHRLAELEGFVVPLARADSENLILDYQGLEVGVAGSVAIEEQGVSVERQVVELGAPRESVAAGDWVWNWA